MEAPKLAQRLVYSPKVWVYVKNINEEIIDLTDYCVAGEVKRLINQVSTAEVRLRNPEMIFTTPPVAFHPMDPITIFMERLPGRPVQVFTGYLDSTPYLQLFPGVVTLRASCTLKKLLYTFFQMGQTYTIEFFKHFGWIPHGDGSIGPALEGGLVGSQLEKELEKIGGEGIKKTPNGIPFGTEGAGGQSAAGARGSNDGSFSKMLWALLYYIGDWRDENIYIEEVPATVPKLLTALWTDFDITGHEEEKRQLEAYWSALVGPAQGSGGGAGNENGSVVETGSHSLQGWANDMLLSLNVPVTRENLKLFMGWAKEEGGEPFGPGNGARYNPLNTTYKTGASTTTGTQGNIGVYTSWQEGLIATVKTLQMPAYVGIIAALKKDSNSASIVAGAIAASPWNPSGGEAYANAISGIASDQSVTQAIVTEKKAQEEGAKGVVGATNAGGSGNRENEEEISGSSNAGGGGKERTEQEAEQHQRGSTESKGKTGTGMTTRLQAMEEEANKITEKHYPYAWGGGHPSAGKPSIGEEGGPPGSAGVFGFDCAGSVAAALVAGGYVAAGSPIGSSGEFGDWAKSNGFAEGPASGSPSVTVYYNAVHAWLLVKNDGQERYFSTSNSNPGGGAGWRPGDDGENEGEFSALHLTGLTESFSGSKAPPLPASASEAESKVATSEAGIMSAATAASFLSQVQLPSAEERAKALILGGQKALMNSAPLMNMAQEVCKSSLRSFMSLPNGDFYAFYPDYFGEFGHRNPYWKIYNIEILDGGIELNDANLVTHVFTVGNTIWPGQKELINEVNAGVMTIFEAFQPGILQNLGQSEEEEKGSANKLNRLAAQDEAIKFLKRYGARPLKEEFPMVYSTLFETLLAYQQFLLAWSRQFETPFTFTFMPELFPGGKVAFPEHGLQMYVESVTHTWNLVDGYQTVATLIAPSVYQETSDSVVEGQGSLPPNMIDALLEPQRGEVRKTPTAPKSQPALPHVSPGERVEPKPNKSGQLH